MAARVFREHEAAGSRPATETSPLRVLGCGRSSMAEPWAVNPLVPVRLRPVTPKRMRTPCVANSSGRVPASYPGKVRVRAPGDAPLPPRGEIGKTHRFQKPAPQGMSVRLGPRGPINSPVAQRQSSALIRRRPVDRDHPGLPTASTTKEVCHETDRRRRLVSRSRASDARATRPRRRSSEASASFAASRSWPKSSAAMIRARADRAGRFKRCCLRSGCF